MSDEVERPRSGLSMASSIATTTSVNQGSRPSTRSIKRVHTFGKREYSIKRDPNSPVVIRGWLYKQDSQGLRLWKRRWFVLSNFCLFYYRDSREETVLGSILLPSYEILPANPREVKNRRFSFKAEHPGMRTYYFGADTQEDMNAWIRAMNQSALVVADHKNKSSHGHNLTSQDDLYASYEDFSHSEINTEGDDGKSAESLEIAHLSETRSQDESSRDSLPEHDRNGDFEKDRLFSGLRESLSDAMQHHTSVSQNGAVPPPTPECSVKNMEFAYSRQEVESKVSLEGKDSIPEDEEWVPFHKDQSSAECHQARSPSQPHPNGFECPHDEYASPLSCSAPSSTMLPNHIYGTEVTERNWNSRDEKFIQQNENVDNQNVRIMASHPTSPSQNSACPIPDKEYIVQRLVKASRSQSLPPTSSEVSRHLMVHRSPPPNLKYASPIHYMDVPHQNATSSISSPTRKEMPLTPSLSPKIQSPKQRAASNEDVFVAVTGSPSLGRITVRSNTPIGRVDILPSEDRISNSVNVRHNEERTGEYYVTSSRTRSHIVKPVSRPQTPSDRYDVLPSDDPFPASTLAKGPNRYTRRSQPLGTEDERMVDGIGMILNPRAHGYPNRIQVRPNTPSERILVEEYAPELSLTPSLRRHRSQGPRYSDRPFLPAAACSGRGVGYAPRHLSKMGSASYIQLPPLPPVSTRPHLPPGKRMSLSAMPSGSTPYRDHGPYAGRVPENGIDVLLNKMCGQDKLLISIEEESAHLRAEKDKLEDALQLTHHHLEEFHGQEQAMENIWYQQRMLQDDLVYVRARLCDLSLERERAWDDYRALENELHTVRETLERVSMIGHPQDQAAAHRDVWMINDIMAGLRFNNTNFHVIPDPARLPAAVMPPSPVSETQPTFQRSFLHSQSGLNPLSSRDNPSDFEAIPPRPPLPRDHHTANDETEGQNRGSSTKQNDQDPTSEHTENTAAQLSTSSSDAAVSIRDVPDARPSQLSCPLTIPSSPKVTLDPKASPPSTSEVGTVRKQRMSTEEQMERMRRHQEAQIHEKPKPGVTAQRQNSQRSTSGPAGGRLRSSSSDTFTTGTSSQQAEKSSLEQRKPALVRVTASFYPSSVTSQNHGKQGMSPDTGPEDPTYCVVMEPHMESVKSTTSHEISQVVKVTPPLRTSSKIVSARCLQVKNDKQGDSKISSVHPDLQRTADRMKTSACSTSPATSPRSFKRLSDDGYTSPIDEERERIMNLSYTLATEASERGKIITAKVLSEDCDASSDISSSEETYPWDFLQDTCSSKTSSAKENCQLKTTVNQSSREERSLSNDGNSCLSVAADQGGSEGASSPNIAKERPNKRLLDNLHYENWPGHKHDGNKNHFPATKQDNSAPAKCSGQVAKYDFLIEDLHYNPINLGKVTDYCKEEREPIRITLLQSSF